MKATLKSALQLLALLMALPLVLLDLILRLLSEDGGFAAISQLLSLLPGKTGSYLRVGFYRLAMRKCAANCHIGFGTLFSQRDTEIGAGVYIGPQCNIGSCRIGNDTLIASGVHVMSGTRQHFIGDLGTPIREQGGEYQAIAIGQDCWIGNGALIMAELGSQCVIGAGSVVSQPIPPLSIAVGNPARVIRHRDGRGAVQGEGDWPSPTPDEAAAASDPD